jgi:hypothetical protein
MSAFRGVCEFCHEDVRSGKAAFRVRGWELERAQGGANQIVGKERQPNRIAHALCVSIAVRQEKRGLSGQTSLIGE